MFFSELENFNKFHVDPVSYFEMNEKPVTIGGFCRGSSAERYRIVRHGEVLYKINDKKITDLNDLISVIRTISHQSSVKMHMLSYKSSIRIATLVVDCKYFPTYNFQRSDNSKSWSIEQIV